MRPLPPAVVLTAAFAAAVPAPITAEADPSPAGMTPADLEVFLDDFFAEHLEPEQVVGAAVVVAGSLGFGDPTGEGLDPASIRGRPSRSSAFATGLDLHSTCRPTARS